MLGINYESSDDEEAVPEIVSKLPNPSSKIAPAATSASAQGLEASKPLELIHEPAQGPTAPAPPPDDEPANGVPPGSPYTSTRLTIQNLTLPTVPNWDIPPSPPGSPPQKSTKKFSQFLELKKKGEHFNRRLENSVVLRDPTHLRRLMEFAEISEEDQYASTLPPGLGVLVKWPEWACGDQLNASQKRISQAKHEARAKVPRQSIDFVSARSGSSTSTAMPSARPGRQGAAGRVIGGPDPQDTGRAHSQGTSKRKELEHRGGRDSNVRLRSSSRSPKRRRSRSRERR